MYITYTCNLSWTCVTFSRAENMDIYEHEELSLEHTTQVRKKAHGSAVWDISV